MKGIIFDPLLLGGPLAFRRFCTNKHASPLFFLHLLLQHSPCYKDGAKIVKIIYVDTNQMDELTLHLDSCAYDGASVMKEPFIEGPLLLQWYSLVDMLNTHMTHYITPSHAGPMHQLDLINKKLNIYENDLDNAVEAGVSSFYNQVDHRLMRHEPGLLTNGRSTQQLSGSYLRPANPEETVWSSMRTRTFLVADQDKPRYWCGNESVAILPIDRSKTLEQALEEVARGPNGTPTMGTEVVPRFETSLRVL